MASISDVPMPMTAAEQLARLNGHMRALVMRAGGKIELSMEDMRRGNDPRFDLRLSHDPKGFPIIIEMIDPAAPVEGGHYWVKVLGSRNAEWKAAHFCGGKFFLTGWVTPYDPSAVQVGDRIHTPPPAPPAAESAPPEGIPAGYGKLDPGVRCRCIRLWQHPDGSLWCCRPRPTADKTAGGFSTRV